MFQTTKQTSFKVEMCLNAKQKHMLDISQTPYYNVITECRKPS